VVDTSRRLLSRRCTCPKQEQRTTGEWPEKLLLRTDARGLRRTRQARSSSHPNAIPAMGKGSDRGRKMSAWKARKLPSQLTRTPRRGNSLMSRDPDPASSIQGARKRMPSSSDKPKRCHVQVPPLPRGRADRQWPCDACSGVRVRVPCRAAADQTTQRLTAHAVAARPPPCLVGSQKWRGEPAAGQPQKALKKPKEGRRAHVRRPAEKTNFRTRRAGAATCRATCSRGLMGAPRSRTGRPRTPAPRRAKPTRAPPRMSSATNGARNTAHAPVPCRPGPGSPSTATQRPRRPRPSPLSRRDL
jgi:hypothetical protein